MSRIPESIKYIGKKYIFNPIKRKMSVVPPFPPELWIENTNHCNASCVMCPRDLHTRPLGIMKLDLFTRLMDEASAHAARIKRVHLHNYGEPLLDKDLPERIRLAKKAGIREVYFVTNASLLTPEKSREIIEAGLDEFKISFYGTDRETYNATMRELDFDKSIQNVRDFFRVRHELKARRPGVIIQYLV